MKLAIIFTYFLFTFFSFKSWSSSSDLKLQCFIDDKLVVEISDLYNKSFAMINGSKQNFNLLKTIVDNVVRAAWNSPNFSNTFLSEFC